MAVPEDINDQELGPARPRTLTVMALLVTAAGVLSYLFAYAGADALMAADVLPSWSPGRDPRPGWLVVCFGSLLGAFLLTACLFRFLSKRQLRRIDEIADDEIASQS